MIIAAVDKFSKPLKQATAMIGKLGSMAKGVGKVIGALGLAVTAAAAAFVALGKKAFDALDDVGKTADRTGIAAEKIQALRLAAVESGASVEDLNKGIEKFAKNIGDVVVKGTGEATYALDRMGIQLRNNSGHLKTNDELLREVVEGIGKLGQESERASILQSMFGRAGIKMNQVFGDGVVAFDAWIRKAEEMGFVVSGKTIKAVESFNDRFSELQFIASGLVNQTFAALSPMLDTLITNFRDWIIEINKTEGGLADLGKAIAGELVEGLATAIESMGSVVQWFKETSLWIDYTRDKFKLLNEMNSPWSDWENLKKLREEYEKNKANLEDYSEKTKTIADGLRALFKNSTDAKGGINGLGGSTDDLGDKLSQTAESLKRFGAGINIVGNKSKDMFEDLEKLGENVANTLEKGLTDAFMNIGKGLNDLKDLFSNIMQMIARELVRIHVVLPMVSAVGGMFKAEGGPVRAGRSYIVGERGPELFTPSASGHIVPNDKLGGGGGIVVNQSINLTTGVVPTVRAEVQKLLPEIAEVTKGAVAEAAMRGGSYRRALQGG